MGDECRAHRERSAAVPLISEQFVKNTETRMLNALRFNPVRPQCSFVDRQAIDVVAYL